MKKLTLAVAAVLAAGASASFARDLYWNSPRDPYYVSRDHERRVERDFARGDFARVTETRYIGGGSGREECWNPRAGTYEEVRPENRTRIGKGAAAGAVVGGVLGHQVDRGEGTAAGAILGGILGHHLERRNDRVTQEDLDYTRCRSFASAPAYEVRYVYDGREYVTHMNHDPGRRLRVGVDTRPDGTPNEYSTLNDPAYSGG